MRRRVFYQEVDGIVIPMYFEEIQSQHPLAYTSANTIFMSNHFLNNPEDTALVFKHECGHLWLDHARRQRALFEGIDDPASPLYRYHVIRKDIIHDLCNRGGDIEIAYQVYAPEDNDYINDADEGDPWHNRISTYTDQPVVMEDFVVAEMEKLLEDEENYEPTPKDDAGIPEFLKELLKELLKNAEVRQRAAGVSTNPDDLVGCNNDDKEYTPQIQFTQAAKDLVDRIHPARLCKNIRIRNLALKSVSTLIQQFQRTRTYSRPGRRDSGALISKGRTSAQNGGQLQIAIDCSPSFSKEALYASMSLAKSICEKEAAKPKIFLWASTCGKEYTYQQFLEFLREDQPLPNLGGGTNPRLADEWALKHPNAVTVVITDDDTWGYKWKSEAQIILFCEEFKVRGNAKVIHATGRI